MFIILIQFDDKSKFICYNEYYMKYIIFIIGFFFIAPFSTYAALPSVTSFIAGSYFLNSGQSASFAPKTRALLNSLAEKKD